MSILDGDSNPINIKFPTLGGEVFWQNLDTIDGYRLQKNTITGHCRIIDSENIRVAWGDEGPMRAKLHTLTCKHKDMYPKYGDVIGVHRMNGLYDHYGIYENKNCIYEYAGINHDFGKSCIHTTTLQNFIRNSKNCFTLTFPKEHGKPGKIDILENNCCVATIGLNWENLKEFRNISSYYLYTPDETIKRAKSRLGEEKYGLISNNCEHFAIWCKTGIHESHQVNALLKLLETFVQV